MTSLKTPVSSLTHILDTDWSFSHTEVLSAVAGSHTLKCNSYWSHTSGVFWSTVSGWMPAEMHSGRLGRWQMSGMAPNASPVVAGCCRLQVLCLSWVCLVQRCTTTPLGSGQWGCAVKCCYSFCKLRTLTPFWLAVECCSKPGKAGFYTVFLISYFLILNHFRH